MAELNFSIKDAPGFEPIPAGEYQAQIIASQMKETKSGTGMYLELRLQILDEDFAGRQVFDRINLVNDNETAVQIGQRTLASICKALDLEGVEDSQELHDQPLTVKLVVKPATEEWDASNEVKKYSAA